MPGRTSRRVAVPATPWEQALEARQNLEAVPEDARTKADYARALDRFRAIYHDNPRDAHAPEAVNAVAQLLAEQGRSLDDVKSLQAAVGQYEFLRTQYPGSSLRMGALLAEGKIEAEDLHDPKAAKERFALVVKTYPRSGVATEARAGIAELGKAKVVDAAPRGLKPPASEADMAGLKPRSFKATTEGRGTTEARAGVVASGQSVPGDEEITADSSAALRSDNKESVAGSGSAPRGLKPALVGQDSAGLKPRPFKATAETAPNMPVKDSVGTARTARGAAAVTGIRHWSTPTYTRVAIDLGDEVTFEAARVPHPDRIYFDLHGAKLAQELVGKSFSVTDDGFLKKIRAAQSSADVTRVVLDVNDVTEYSAFLLPNPYRLIIDIHGSKAVPGDVAMTPAPSVPKAEVKTFETAERVVPANAGRKASAAANASGLPPMAVTDGGEAVRPLEPNAEQTAALIAPANNARGSVPAPRVGAVTRATTARPVPNTVVEKAPTTTNEVAAVSELPGRVEATTAPSTRPIAAVVLGSREKTSTGVPAVTDVAIVTKKTKAGAKASANAIATTGDEGVNAAPTKAAEKTADGETSLIRALGLRIGRIVIDAGHGGHDSGTLGVDGIQEKDVVLDVALRLGKMLHERLGAEIIYTRSDDTFIPLETRTAIANKAQADLFLSIHANSSSDESARGVETYYLNFTSDPNALDVAARENAVSGQGIHQLSDLVKKITLKDKIAESREFASDVEGSLYAGLERGNAGLKNRGVKKAPFVVLIGANMPSILAEISFVTNAQDASQLRMPEYRQRVAESLFNGVAKYENSLGGGKPVVMNRASVK